MPSSVRRNRTRLPTWSVPWTAAEPPRATQVQTLIAEQSGNVLTVLVQIVVATLIAF